MEVLVIPALTDNYIYLLHDGRSAAVIDPADAGPVFAALDEHGLKLDMALVTHSHLDHTAGCDDLAAATGCAVAGPGQARTPAEGEVIHAAGVDLSVIAVPGHTAGDIAYYAAAQKMLWTGDTLFVAGCGRIFSGAAATMWNALSRIRELPDDVAMYCGHEYTVENLEFALHLEPDNVAVAQRLAQAKQLRRNGQPTVPSLLGLEKATNPFLRSDSNAMRRAVTMPDAAPADVFAELRRRKDRW